MSAADNARAAVNWPYYSVLQGRVVVVSDEGTATWLPLEPPRLRPILAHVALAGLFG